jgi:cyclin-dependent kinase 7
MSVEAVTLWYKPPEMLLGEFLYSPAADMWSVGCIFAEMLLRRPFLPAPGPADTDQLTKIFQTFGVPTKDNWPTYDLLPLVARGVKWSGSAPPSPWEAQFEGCGDDALDLLKKIMPLDPQLRLSADECLLHPYFSNEPFMAKRQDLPIPGVKIK